MNAVLLCPDDDDESDYGPVLFYRAERGEAVLPGEVWEDCETVRQRFRQRFGLDPECVMAVTRLDLEAGEVAGYVAWEEV